MINYSIELSDDFKKIWGLMLKSKESAAPATSVWDGLCRVNKLTSDYIFEMYGSAAIEYKGRYYTPDCKIIPAPQKTTEQRRAEIRGESLTVQYTPDAETVKAEHEFETMKAKKYTPEVLADKVAAWKTRNPDKTKDLAPSQYIFDLCEEIKIVRQA